MAQPTGQEGKAQQSPRQNQGLKPRTGVIQIRGPLQNPGHGTQQENAAPRPGHDRPFQSPAQVGLANKSIIRTYQLHGTNQMSVGKEDQANRLVNQKPGQPKKRPAQTQQNPSHGAKIAFKGGQQANGVCDIAHQRQNGQFALEFIESCLFTESVMDTNLDRCQQRIFAQKVNEILPDSWLISRAASSRLTNRTCLTSGIRRTVCNNARISAGCAS